MKSETHGGSCRTLEINKRLAKAYFFQASLYFARGRSLEGDLALTRALDIDPESLHAQLLSLRRKLLKGELKNVERQLSSIIQKYPLESEVLRLQADMYIIRGDYIEAEALLHKIVVIDNSDLIQFSLARVLYLRGLFRQVIPVIQPLVEKHPQDWETAYLYAATLNRLGQFDESLKVCLPFLKNNQGDGFIHRLAGDLFRSQENETEALKIYKTGMEYFPGNLELVDALSSVYMSLQKWPQVKELLLNQTDRDTYLTSLFLDRLVLTFQQLGDNANALLYRRRFNEKNDPVLRAQGPNMESRLLFSVSSPILQYESLSHTYLPESN
ncbi:MAG: hypothetical protein HQM12_21245 [SAR324 cluster bacterium]|nr:hypothetical protein [SAR324 cluster bacterium]